MLSVLVAAELRGSTHNFEITFPTPPSLDEIRRQGDAIFAIEAARAGEAFSTDSLKVYDGTVRTWVDLTDPMQLTQRCQLFAVPRPLTAAAPRLTVRHAPPPLPPTPTQKQRGVGGPPSPTAATVPLLQPQRVRQSPPLSAGSSGAAVLPVLPVAPPAPVAPAAPLSPALGPMMPVMPTMPVMPAAAVGGPVGGAMQLASYSVPSSSRLAPTQTVPEAHTFDDKVDLLFREFDRNTDHVLDLDELRNAFGLFSNVFSPATIADLVAKIDYKRTSAVSRSDWEKFCQRYPTLVDAFYCRVRAFLEMSSRQAGIDEAQLRLQQLRDAEARARQAVEDGRRAHQGAEERLAAAEEALRRAIEEQRELERAVMQSRRDVDQQQLECTRYASELDSQRQKEAHAARVHADCAQHLAHVTQLHSTANAQLVKFADQEQHNAAMSIQIKTDIERFRSEVSQLRITIHELKQREQATGHGLAETLRDVVVSGERMNAIDLEVAALQAREHDLRDALNRAMDATTTAAALKDEEHMAFRALKDAESGSAIELSAAQASADEVAQRLRHLESENEAFQHKRVEVEQQEVPLIHQEIRLRHQRHFLEEEEMLLRGNHTLFVEAASSVDVGQRPSRLVSPDLKEAAPLPPSPRAVPEPLHAYHDRPDVALAPLPAGHYTAAPTAHPYHVETTSWAASHAHAASFSSTTRQTESAIAAYTSAGARGARY